MKCPKLDAVNAKYVNASTHATTQMLNLIDWFHFGILTVKHTYVPTLSIRKSYGLLCLGACVRACVRACMRRRACYILVCVPQTCQNCVHACVCVCVVYRANSATERQK